jgi:galactokinase
LTVATHAYAFAPGRVNLIGEHTDYNGGLALPFAIAQGVKVLASALPDRRIDAYAADVGEHDSFRLSAPLEPGAASGWRAFVRGAVAELQLLGIPLPGAEVEISGDVPRGGGLSSSAALEVALVLALLALSGAEPPGRIELAKLCSRVENDWVGARTGLLDQLASLYGEPDRALRIDFRTLEVAPVPLELGEYALVTLDSGEQHTNAGGGYNERREECAQACEQLDVQTLSKATLEQAASLPEPLAARARHVITENARVRDAVAALERGDLEAVGALLNASHESLRDCFEVSTAAVERAVQRLIDAGALGARIMGGGFGGNVLGLMAPDASIPEDAVRVGPGPGARVRG